MKKSKKTSSLCPDIGHTPKNNAGRPAPRFTIRKKLRTTAGRKLSATEIIILGFALMVLLGAFLLMLPISSKERCFTDPVRAFFTAVSASCVTGLTVLPTGAYWSLFGQSVILVLIQIGGLGFMTMAVMLSIFVKRQITPRERLITAQALGLNGSGGTVRLVKRILRGTFAIEAVGAIILTFRFMPRYGIAKSIFYGIFHSVSSFCNAGFDLLDSFKGYENDYLLCSTLMLLIVLGGIGFIVWDDIVNLVFKRQRVSVYTKLVLTVTIFLLVSGTALIALFEWNNPATIGNMNAGDKLFQSLFQSVTTRTAGIDLIGNADMTESSKLVCLFLMLIGGASGSTAGGVKVATLGVIVLAVAGSACGRSEVNIGNRKIPQNMIVRALTVFSINLSAGIVGGLLISIRENVSLLTALYETISAISTVGLSFSLSPTLSIFSMIVDMLLMFFGRVGILTITYTIMLNQARKDGVITYPEADLLIG